MCKGADMIASWTSSAAKWSAHLYKQANGYRLSERKYGSEVGALFVPFTTLITDEDAIQYFNHQVMTRFDVKMQRVDP
jgi:hypothetical protein